MGGVAVMRTFLTPRDLDGWAIDGTSFSRHCGWDVIAEHVAKYFRCDPDDVSTAEETEEEPEEGREYITIKGKRVGYIDV
jgi:hypothetical protein